VGTWSNFIVNIGEMEQAASVLCVGLRSFFAVKDVCVYMCVVPIFV
jgi:hypothetical protein